MIIAIDGPAGAGKSTTARAIAQRFHYAYIDTGAMYRAVALACDEQGLQVGSNDEAIIELAAALPLSFADNGQRILIGQRDVSAEIRTPRVSEISSSVSTLGPLREVIVDQQRRVARAGEELYGGAVLEGRDIQTVVFPDAEVKIFLVADPAIRAARRLAQWQESSAAQAVSVEEATRDIIERDTRDSERASSPLRPADDAVHLSTDDLSPAGVLDRISEIIEAKGGVRA